VLRRHLASDGVTRQRAEYRTQPDPTYLTHGPKTPREFLNLRRWQGTSPG
jgi:hypothetical protein